MRFRWERWWRTLQDWLTPGQLPVHSFAAVTARNLSPRPAEPCRLLTLTDGVSRLLFDEYACHTRSVDGHEETGWILLGRRYGDRALALATIPAGDQSDASSVHVRFDPIVQTVVSRLIRQGQPDLGILGIVHTHPGSLRHPSSGDYRGDIQWVRQLPGAEGIFGIGTADAAYPESLVACQEQPHQHGWGKHRFSWYALSQSDSNYRPLEVSWTLGDDLGECWRKVWPALEAHAPGLNRLATIVPTLHYDIRPGEDQREWLVLTLATGTEEVVQLWLSSSRIRYLLGRGGDYFEADYAEPRVDRGLFHLLSEIDAEVTGIRYRGVFSPAEVRCVMDFRPLNDSERRQLVQALRGNAEQGKAILMDPRDTTFQGTADKVPDTEVIHAIQSIPCHY